MKRSPLPMALLLAGAIGFAVASADAATLRIDADPAALAAAMGSRRSVLLGEVHDNGEQHALRLAALRLRIAAGARPALAFEQFDRERQGDIDRIRREQPGDADALIAAVGARNWDWKHYRPFVQLALDHDLPIVAANLSRADAVKVSMNGWDAVFDVATQSALGLDRLPASFVEAHEAAVARGHCELLPPSALPPMARAQIARDIVLAQSLRPHLPRGVVLLGGNGHVRRDIGVPAWLTADERRDVLAIGLLEGPEVPAAEPFDAVVVTAATQRPDPCIALRQRLQGSPRP